MLLSLDIDRLIPRKYFYLKDKISVIQLFELSQAGIMTKIVIQERERL